MTYIIWLTYGVLSVSSAAESHQAHSNSIPRIDAVRYQALFEHKDLPYGLLRAIASVESSNNPTKINYKTHDYGLMQINALTATRYGKLPTQMLDPAQGIAVSVKLLKQYQRQFGHEPMWECRYNLGTHREVPKWDSCKKYMDLLHAAGYSKNVNKNYLQGGAK